MPRITDARRQSNRAQIVAAARRCFAREGFHQTSMPDIAVEAGVSTGAPYRYFASKEELILEIAGDAFRVIFDPVGRLADSADGPTVADLVAAALAPVGGEVVVDEAGAEVPVDELLRCSVQAWGEILRHPGLRQQANDGFERVRRRIAEALRHGQDLGVVPADTDPDQGARVVIAVLHGFVLQRVAFGLDDTKGFAREARTLLTTSLIASTGSNPPPAVSRGRLLVDNQPNDADDESDDPGHEDEQTSPALGLRTTGTRFVRSIPVETDGTMVKDP